ncbi:MAG: tetratricopeptide repeat protein [Deltaproteobacteria bacterium]
MRYSAYRRSSAYRLMAIVLLLVSGCATPPFSGAEGRSQADSGAQRQAEAGAATSPAITRNSPFTDRKAPGLRSASRDTAITERRIEELLVSASRSQSAGRLDVARSAYEQVLRLDSRNMKAHYQLACIADDQGRFEDAQRHYSVLLDQAPHNPDVLASLGWSCLLQGKYDDCEQTLREALRYAPSHQTALYNLGWLYGTRGDYEQALAIFRSAGTEAEAQRAIAELQQNAPRNPARDAPALAATTRRSSSPPQVVAGTVAQTTYSEAEPSVGATRLGANASQKQYDRAAPGSIHERFSEIDAYASSSPTQANQPRQAEPQTYDVGAGRGVPAPGTPPVGMEPVHYEPPAPQAGGQQGPIITPGVAGGGMINSRQGTIARNILQEANSRPSVVVADDAPATMNAGEWSRNAPADSRLPGRQNSAAGDRSAPASPGTRPPRRDGSSWQDAQLAAAQLGLGAGLGGPFFTAGDWCEPPAAPASSLSKSMTAPVAPQAGRLPPPDGIVSRQNPSVPRQPPTTQSAGFGTSAGESSAPPSPGLPPRAGRPPIPAAVPTDVTPVVRSPASGAAATSPLPGSYPDRTIPSASR